MNPRVEIKVDTKSLDLVDTKFYQSFDMVCMTGCSPLDLVKVNKICHQNDIKFWASQIFGFHSFIFADLVKHDFHTETKKTGSDGDSVIKTERSLQFVDLESIMNHKFGNISEKSPKKWKRMADPLYFGLMGKGRFVSDSSILDLYDATETISNSQR